MVGGYGRDNHTTNTVLDNLIGENMFDRNRIQQNFVAVFQQNIGNRITPELANGMIAVLMAAVPEMHIENSDGEKINVNDTTTTASDEPTNSVPTGAG